MEWSCGIELWNGVVEWSCGMELWNGVVDCGIGRKYAKIRKIKIQKSEKRSFLEIHNSYTTP